MRFSGIISYIAVSVMLFSYAFTLDVNAEPREFIYDHYSSEDGLPHNSIGDIHQDCRGYLWLCTWYGLSRFDGDSFVNYTMIPGDCSNLSHNRFLSITEDRNGYLWLITYDYHLYRFDVETEEFFAVPTGLEGFGQKNIKINGIHCDKEGNVWVRMAGNGLLKVRRDLSYHLFNDTPQVLGQEIAGLYEDSDGVIYAVSETGISRISGEDVTLLSRNPGVVGFIQLGNTLFFAMKESLLAVDRGTREHVKVNLKSLGAGKTTAMTCVEIGGEDHLVIGTDDNALIVMSNDDMNPRLLRHKMGRVRYLFPDHDMVWIATERTGIWSYNFSGKRFKHYEHSNNVMSYYSDTLANVSGKGDMLWIKMNNYGFGYYDRENDEILPLDNVKECKNCRFMNGVPCFEVDSTGVLWMSTVGRGLERVTVLNHKVKVMTPPTRFPHEKSSSEVRAMLRDSKDRLWMATKSRELYCYSPDLKECRRFPDAESGDVGVIYSIFEDRDGNIWLGTKGDGLIRIKTDTKGYSWKRFTARNGDFTSLSSNNIYSIAQDKDGRIWIGTFGGGISMLPTADSDEFITVSSNFPDYPQEMGDRVRYLHCMPDGKMLVATVGGLIWFEPSEAPELTVFNTVTKIPGDMRSLGNNDVMHIFTDRAGNTWLSTFGGGLNRLDFENGLPRFDIISTSDGLASNIILSAADDGEGVIWVATEAGLSSYDPATSEIVNYTRYDGVKSTSFSEATCSSLADGRVIFGTLDNAYVVNPESFGQVQRDSRLTVTGVSVDEHRLTYSDEVVIPAGYSSFRIDFASLNFSNRSRTNFVYMLDGYDKGWIKDAGGYSATYSNIPPGRYVFKVSTKSTSDASEDQVSLDVHVSPTIWNSALAKLIYILLCLSLALIMVRALAMYMKMRSDVRVEKDLNDLKGRFFTNISHELRTPLTLILGGIDEIRKRIPEGAVNDYSVNMVQKNAKRMMTLVNQLLDIRTIVNGKMRLKVSQFDVVRLVQGVYDDFRDMSSEHQMDMRIIKSVDSLMVWGDQIRIEALVYNLLSNAFKYTADGGKIEVGVLYREGDSEFRIMVKDNGIGVPKNMQKSIFEPFDRGAGTSGKGMPSSGIGLSFCKEIADIHGGEIWVESRNESGSKFFVRLPISRDRFSDDTAQFIDSAGDIQQAESYGLSKFKAEPSYQEGALKILVVEDNAEMRIYIYNSLVTTYEVRDASNGKDALQIISEGWIPDMIVTDLMMPVMDGIELTNNIRNDFNTSHIPIVMITAKHEDDTHLKAMKYGADGYIAKPFTMELLVARIENMLERRKSLISTLSSPIALPERDKRTGKVIISPEEIVITDKDEQLIKKVMSWLEENISDVDITVEQLATHVGMGRTSMYNKLKGLTGKSPVELIQEFRLEKSTYYLKSGQFSVSETSYKVGFSDPGYFSRSFKKYFGMTPADYIKNNRNRS